MGCLLSTPEVSGETRRRPKNVGEIVVFVPGLRIPMPLDFAQPLGDGLSKSLVERLSALRTRIVVMAGQEAPMTTKRKRTATQHGGSTLADLQQALEDYLPVLLGLVENAFDLKLERDLLFFHVDSEQVLRLFDHILQETTMSDSWYEVLSVLHLMAILSLSQANLLLLPNTSADGYKSKVLEECKRTSIDIFLKAAGYLEFAVQQVLPQLPLEIRKDLPLDLTEGVLKALCLQALGLGVEIQLGMAIDSAKATLAVKRRLACEMVKYWQQAQEYIDALPLTNGWGEKHKLYIRWKHVEAKAVAYYLHGLILEERNTERSPGVAAAALQAAEEYLKEGKKACESFHMAPPSSRNPPLWGASKYLAERIPKDISSKTMNWESHNHEMIMQLAPALPDFALSLKPDEYQLPSMDPSWNELQVQD